MVIMKLEYSNFVVVLLTLLEFTYYNIIDFFSCWILRIYPSRIFIGCIYRMGIQNGPLKRLLRLDNTIIKILIIVFKLRLCGVTLHFTGRITAIIFHIVYYIFTFTATPRCTLFGNNAV